MKKIRDVRPYLFDDSIILSFNKNWMDLFKKIPTFTVLIDNKNRLQIVSKDPIKSGADLCE